MDKERKQKGGFQACMFIFVSQFLENMGYTANIASMVLYFHNVMYFDLASSANTMTNFMGSVLLLSLLGGFIADTYLNRLYTCLTCGALEVLGLAMVTIQAYSKNLQPDDCGKSSCVSGGEAYMLYGSLCFLALGAGGVRGALPALGGDQFDEQDKGDISTYYNLSFLSLTTGATVGVVFLVWINMNKGWYLGFFIETVITLLGYIVLAFGKPFFRIQPLGKSPFIKIAKVLVGAYRNRSLSLPKGADELYEIDDAARDPSEERIPHTKQFSSLDKAAILREDTVSEASKVCTVTQVEELKVLIRMMPIIGSTVLMNTCLAQLQTFSVQQGTFMDPQLGSIKIPTASMPVIPLLFMSILVPLYEYLAVPLARNITGNPSGIPQLQRVGVGLALSVISMSIAGGIEAYRKDQANGIPTKEISVFWLSFQFGVFGIAEMFTVVGLLDFFYTEAPAGMKSLTTSFTYLSLSLGYFLSTIFVSVIDAVTQRITPSKQGWLHGNDLNSNNLNLFFWFLAVLSSINFAIYLYCASWYKYKEEKQVQSLDQPK